MIFLQNNTWQTNDHISEETLRNGFSIYEVIRIFNGKPIFLKDNLLRLGNSLNKSNINIKVKDLDIPEKLKRFTELQDIHEGNLKYILHFESGKVDEYLFQIPHNYPSADEYKHGVKTITYEAIRENPEVKYINEELRNLTNHLIHKHDVYEVLLIDKEGFITEGSRSNVFFIKENTLYTSPLEYVLPGTSRKRVIDICHAHNIAIVEERIDSKELSTYDAAFLTGTSPLILPICQINDMIFSVQSTCLKQLMKYYFALLEE